MAVSLQNLRQNFFNHSNVIYFSELYPKTTAIASKNGVPRYAYSNSTGRYIPSTGSVSLEDFKNVKCQTNAILITCQNVSSSSGYYPPINWQSDSVDITFTTDHNSLNVIYKGTVLFNIKVYFSYGRRSARGYGGYGGYGGGGGGSVRFEYIEIKYNTSNLILLVNVNTYTCLGEKDNINEPVGVARIYSGTKLAFVLIQDLNFNV